jgi:hypothetical protein
VFSIEYVLLTYIYVYISAEESAGDMFDPLAEARRVFAEVSEFVFSLKNVFSTECVLYRICFL